MSVFNNLLVITKSIDKTIEYNEKNIGEIKMYAGTTLPDSFLWCDGTNISTNSNYSKLKTYLNSDNTPDLRDQFIYGTNDPDLIGSNIGNNTINVLPSHNHSITNHELSQHNIINETKNKYANTFLKGSTISKQNTNTNVGQNFKLPQGDILVHTHNDIKNQLNNTWIHGVNQSSSTNNAYYWKISNVGLDNAGVLHNNTMGSGGEGGRFAGGQHGHYFTERDQQENLIAKTSIDIINNSGNAKYITNEISNSNLGNIAASSSEINHTISTSNNNLITNINNLTNAYSRNEEFIPKHFVIGFIIRYR